jgi:hypothetical protein
MSRSDGPRRAKVKLDDQPEKLPRAIDERVARLQKKARDQQRRELQLKLFPDWADDRRGAPNEVIRSAIFGVVQRGRRKRVIDMPVAGPAGSSISITGWRLDQYDLDIWLEVMHLARNTQPGGTVTFTVRSMLQRLHSTVNRGSTDSDWLKQRLHNLAHTTIAFEDDRFVGVAGALVSSFRIDKTTKEAVVRTNPELRALWESITHLDIEQRRSLGQNQLAKAMHAALASHVAWMPIRLDTLMARVGADFARIRDFRAALDVVLADFKLREWIHGYSIDRGDEGLVAIDKVQTPTQIRAAKRLAAPDDVDSDPG